MQAHQWTGRRNTNKKKFIPKDIMITFLSIKNKEKTLNS